MPKLEKKIELIAIALIEKNPFLLEDLIHLKQLVYGQLPESVLTATVDKIVHNVYSNFSKRKTNGKI